MTDNLITSFLTNYICCLPERTRGEKSGKKFGFDWVIYNLAIAESLISVRLPFFRGADDQTPTTKTEPEFGADLIFLSPNKKKLVIFVLKAEKLKNSTWNSKNFDTDLRNAAAPDLSLPYCSELEEVQIILAYNQDEDQAGIKHYELLTNSLGKKIQDKISLSFERWNLTTITENVKSKLLSSSLLPQEFFTRFNYLCAQFTDFIHGSDEWVKQFIPSWRLFLDKLLKENPDERSVRLIPVMLIILREKGSSNPSHETGWLDLVEWAMLALWDIHKTTQRLEVKAAISDAWCHLYISELRQFYTNHESEFAIEHSLETRNWGTSLDNIVVSVIAHWHIARLGILSMSLTEFVSEETVEMKEDKVAMLSQVGKWLVTLFNTNPSAYRPLLDIHHIEIFLTWRTLWQLEWKNNIYQWLCELKNRLFMRRTKNTHIPFIEGNNSLELVFEHVATNKKPYEFNDNSSLLLLCLLELCFCLENEKREELINSYYKNIVLAQVADGKAIPNIEPIDLICWNPPNDWSQKILKKSLAREGECHCLADIRLRPNEEINVVTGIYNFVSESRSVQKFEVPQDLPLSVIILACLKHQSPLPPELWRLPIFGEIHNYVN